MDASKPANISEQWGYLTEAQSLFLIPLKYLTQKNVLDTQRFPINTQKDGQQFRGRIFQVIEDQTFMVKISPLE